MCSKRGTCKEMSCYAIKHMANTRVGVLTHSSKSYTNMDTSSHFYTATVVTLALCRGMCVRVVLMGVISLGI
jgi:hypothetical protein